MDRPKSAAFDWNVIISVRERGYTMARAILRNYGKVQRTSFHNLLVMKVESPSSFLAALEQRLRENPDLLAYASRIVPLTDAFDFESVSDFEDHARKIISQWAPRLAGRSFYVRMHRRGLKGLIVSPNEEHVLDDCLLDALNQVGTPARLSFEDPDAIVDVETLDHRAGLSLWSREDLKRYPFLKPE